jgi:hypothetical protein
MTLYSLFLFRNGKPAGKVSRHCADDLDALDAARRLCADHTVEVYCDNMLIARVKQGDQPPAVTDRYAG